MKDDEPRVLGKLGRRSRYHISRKDKKTVSSEVAAETTNKEFSPSRHDGRERMRLWG